MCVHIFVHFLAFLYKTTTLNHQNVCCLRTETPTEDYWNSMFLTNTLLKLRCSSVTVNTSSHFRDSSSEIFNSFFYSTTSTALPSWLLKFSNVRWHLTAPTVRVSHQIVNDSLMTRAYTKVDCLYCGNEDLIEHTVIDCQLPFCQGLHNGLITLIIQIFIRQLKKSYLGYSLPL